MCAQCISSVRTSIFLYIYKCVMSMICLYISELTWMRYFRKVWVLLKSTYISEIYYVTAMLYK